MASYKLGFEAKLYIGTAGTAATTELKNVQDVTINLDSSAVDATTRAAGKFKTYIPGMIDSSIDFKILADSSDTNLTTIRTAWMGRSAISAKVELGDGYAFQADVIVDSFKNSQTNDGVIAYDVTFKPTITSDNFTPSVVTVSDGSTSST